MALLIKGIRVFFAVISLIPVLISQGVLLNLIFYAWILRPLILEEQPEVIDGVVDRLSVLVRKYYLVRQAPLLFQKLLSLPVLFQVRPLVNRPVREFEQFLYLASYRDVSQ